MRRSVLLAVLLSVLVQSAGCGILRLEGQGNAKKAEGNIGVKF